MNKYYDYYVGAICETIWDSLRDMEHDYLKTFKESISLRLGVINMASNTIFESNPNEVPFKDKIKILSEVSEAVSESLKAMNRWYLLNLTDDEVKTLQKSIRDEIAENLFEEDNIIDSLKLYYINYLLPIGYYPLDDEDFGNLKNRNFKAFVKRYVYENLDEMKAALKKSKL